MRRTVDIQSLARLFHEKTAARAKPKEEALGIPSRSTFHELPKLKKPEVWEFGVHDHEAQRRGRHFDLRLGDPRTGHAHSWALPPHLPKAGEATWAVQQPTHTVRYMDFEGEIPEGYGAGKVGLHARDRAEVVHSAPDTLRFHVHKPFGSEEFVLHRLGEKMWKLFNVTPTRSKLKVPQGKPKYRSKDPEKIDFDDERYLMSAKIDDAHNLFVLPPGGQVRVVSHRSPTREAAPTDVIDHTHKVPGLSGVETPAGLGGTVLRGGLYAIDNRSRRAMDAHVLGGLLNTDVWKSREKQRQLGHLRPVIYDVERFRGRDMSKAPYLEKLEALRAVQKALPVFELPPMAHSAQEKRQLLQRIAQGKLKETKEGVVLWNLQEGEPAIKSKFVDEHDVYVHDFFPAEKGSKYEKKAVGGFTYSHTPGGEVVGRVGTGISDALRKDMHEHPERYKGLVATVAAQTRFTSGALRAPAFLNWHLDKNPQDKLDLVKHR